MRWDRRWIAGGLLVLALVGVALNVPLSALGDHGSDVPPVGAIWFGASFDPTSFALTAHGATAAAGSPVALVASLPNGARPGDLRLHVADGGRTVVDEAVARGTFAAPWSFVEDDHGLFATTLAFDDPGSYECSISDGQGRVLASASISVSGRGPTTSPSTRPSPSRPAPTASRRKP